MRTPSWKPGRPGWPAPRAAWCSRPTGRRLPTADRPASELDIRSRRPQSSGKLKGVVERPDDEHLNWDERWARYRLEHVYGPLRVIDRKGGPPGLHDLEADLHGGEVAAIEITSEVEEARLDLAASADRHLSALKLPGSNNVWRVGLPAHARVNAIRSADVLKLLS